MQLESAGTGVVHSPGATGRLDWMRYAPDAVAVERMEAFFSGRGYEFHRHDTYAIGRTIAGVQSFRYRGAIRNSLPGGTIVLHPDEVHDGQAGAEGGFHYRMMYIKPADIQQVLGGRPLPFIKDGISHDPRLFAAAGALLRDVDRPLEALEYEDAIYDLARALTAATDGKGISARALVDFRAAQLARDYLHADLSKAISLKDLESISGQDRWRLSRDFRVLFGTSPYRYLVMRRLDAVKIALRSGIAPAQAAVDAGFSDQSHMTRHFTKAFGVSPVYWLRLQGP
jgi:AraC-like DNA-binding protein